MCRLIFKRAHSFPAIITEGKKAREDSFFVNLANFVNPAEGFLIGSASEREYKTNTEK